MVHAVCISAGTTLEALGSMCQHWQLREPSPGSHQGHPPVVATRVRIHLALKVLQLQVALHSAAAEAPAEHNVQLSCWQQGHAADRAEHTGSAAQSQKGGVQAPQPLWAACEVGRAIRCTRRAASGMLAPGRSHGQPVSIGSTCAACLRHSLVHSLRQHALLQQVHQLAPQRGGVGRAEPTAPEEARRRPHHLPINLHALNVDGQEGRVGR